MRHGVIVVLLLVIQALVVVVDTRSGALHWREESFGMPRTSSPASFTGFLPKAVPIPPSGPSRSHNSIGLHRRTLP
ncbi:hypothetical protein HPP92_001095 [Vanilla planifolia]|uniref:Uncharacterized protein n=1 Tax=Vanilla planifolia TaxID=51239 RepID=A0A835VD87_VANPL|nr:hypothetical protein HPP92_001095 [Vanilla planifolia]